MSDKLTRLILDMKAIDKLNVKDNNRKASIRKIKWFEEAIDQDLVQ